MARSTPGSTPPARQSGEERRAAVIEAAIEEFAGRGYAGGSTETIARRVGISQPYVFRLFGTKRELFLAAVDAVFAHVQRVFTVAAQSTQGDKLDAMGLAYEGLRSRRHELLLLLQAFSASGEDEIRQEVRRRYRALFEEVRALSGASHTQVQNFFASGMLITIASVLDLPELLVWEDP